MTIPLPVQAALILVARRKKGSTGTRLPELYRPLNIEAALAIQAAVTEHWCDQMDDTIGAWKCALPDKDKLTVAPIYTRTIDSVPPVAVWPKNHRVLIEPELAFFFGKDLPVRSEPYLPEEVDAAIVRTHVALELIGSRYSEPGSCEFNEILADGLMNQGLFIGPSIDPRAGQAEEFVINITCNNGEQITREAIHPAGHARAPVYWLVEFLRTRGTGIISGQAVISGSFAGVIDLPLNSDIFIEYVGLGTLQVNFSVRISY